MLEPTKKRRTETVELRFYGPASKREEASRLLANLGFADTTDTVPLLEAFPELATNASGVAIRGSRAKEDMTQQQLADKVQVPRRHLSEMEHGKRSVGKAMAKRFAEVFHCDYRLFL